MSEVISAQEINSCSETSILETPIQNQDGQSHTHVEPISEENLTRTPSESPSLSKRALKRIRKQEEREQSKEEFRAKRREKKKQRKLKNQELKAQGILKPSQPRDNPSCVPSGIRVVIDCQFDDKMSEKEMKSLCKQLQFCYSSNRRSAKSIDITCTGVSKTLEKYLMQQTQDYKQWKITFTPNHYLQCDTITPDHLIYLTADSENTLETIDSEMTYIIGGLVDHNHHKKECLNKAMREGLRHAKLPISEFIRLQCRKVLAVNHCVDILLKYLITSDWKEAFSACIPQRKMEKDSSSMKIEGRKDDEKITENELNENEGITIETKKRSEDGQDNPPEKKIKLEDCPISCE